jgi:hypothetical protein
MSISERLGIAKRHLASAREYLLVNLEDLSEVDWFWMPDPAITHIAWQVGHLAMAQYGLTLFRQRGRSEIDSRLMASSFRKLFMKGTTPLNDRTAYPAVEEILAVLHRVHEQLRVEIDDFDGPQLDQPVDPPHAAFATRYGALLFAADHEMIHAGQIGLLRRLMGKEPIR